MLLVRKHEVLFVPNVLGITCAKTGEKIALINWTLVASVVDALHQVKIWTMYYHSVAIIYDVIELMQTSKCGTLCSAIS